MDVIQCYAPTNDYSEDVRAQYFDRLESILEKQGRLLSLILSLLVTNWIKISTFGGKHGMQWTTRMQLDDLELADDLALLSHTQLQMLEKTTSVAAASAAVGLSIQHAPIQSRLTEKLWNM
ncbi:unnamed protein product [Schistosoma margrebowiei]|uniref:Uncharacterized protein n=1 Tax=Schistosoma margrebowiei TaxID=48269 RepID=A0A183LE03_9TREM|nr:unnamed protein product [Schistosoma margrebowiei]